MASVNLDTAYTYVRLLIGFIVFNATYNNITVISWRGQFYWWRKPPNSRMSLTNFTT
jgi:hypothetical protein